MSETPLQAASAGPRVLAIGLDGASFELLDPWLESGEMPHLAALVTRGASGGLESVIPPLTPPAWTSAATGVNPGKHGVYNFLRPKFGRPVTEFFGTADWKAPALWDFLAARGIPSIVLHLPATYPPRPVHGALVAGLPLTNVEANSTWPPGLKDELRHEIPGYRLFPDTMLLRTDRDAYYRDAVDTLRAQTDEVLYLMAHREWSLLFTLWHMGDSLKHFFWEDMERAAVDNPRIARAVGIDVNRLFSITFVGGCALAGLGGIIGAEMLPLEPFYALRYLVLFLVVVAVGGHGSFKGSFIAALTLGIIDTAGKFLWPEISAFILFGLVFVLLLWRPYGIIPPKAAT